MNVPGTKANNELALYIAKNFFQWAESELIGRNLLTVKAKAEGSDEVLFSANLMPPKAKGGSRNA